MSHFTELARMDPLNLPKPENTYLCTNCLTVCCESECDVYEELNVNYTERRCYECNSEKLKDLSGDAVDWLVTQVKAGMGPARPMQYTFGIKCLDRLQWIAEGQYE